VPLIGPPFQQRQPIWISDALEDLELLAPLSVGRSDAAFDLDVLACPRCGGRLRLIATVEDATFYTTGMEHSPTSAFLRNCHRAMSAQATLLIVEPLIPPGNAPHLAKLPDVNMLVNFGGRIRTEAEYSALLATTGFTMIRTIPTATPQQYSVIEAKRSLGL
jgi:hypothetical protein